MSTQAEPTSDDTTQDHDGKPYAEHDKLGPLGQKPSVWLSGADARATVVRDVRDQVARARTAIDGLAADPAKAVHRYRKALRRARATVALVAEALPTSERANLRSALRSARRAVSSARDHAVAPEVLARLPLADAHRDLADRILASARQATPATDEIRTLMTDGVRVATTQAEAFEVALPQEVSFAILARGLARTYRAARTARADAKHSRKAFHTWRRRGKELSYQLELIADHGGERAGALRDTYTTMSDRLGAVVDLVMLREFIDAQIQGQPGLTDAAVGPLRGAIDGTYLDDSKAARRDGKPLFERSAKKFAAKVTKAIRRDSEPRQPTLPDHDPGDHDA